jgi:hypothetical protein
VNGYEVLLLTATTGRRSGRAFLLLRGGLKKDTFDCTEWEGELRLGAVRLVQTGREWYSLVGGILGPDGVELVLRYGTRKLMGKADLGNGEEIKNVIRPA